MRGMKGDAVRVVGGEQSGKGGRLDGEVFEHDNFAPVKIGHDTLVIVAVANMAKVNPGE